MSVKGVIPIEEKFLQANYLFALEFKEGFVFGKTVRRRICQYKPWNLIDPSLPSPYIRDISASTHQSELRFRDPRNTRVDILYLKDATNSGYPWILHGSIGLKPQFIRMYPRFPEGQNIPGKFPACDPIRPSSGDNLGYVDGLKSPYQDPTDYIEYVIPPFRHLGAEYYNMDENRAHVPVLNLYFCLYWFKILDCVKDATLIRRIATRDVPAAYLTVGFGDMPLGMGSSLMADWKIKPISLDEAVALGGY